MDLDTLPDNTGRAVAALNDYDWQSAEAREAYQEIKDLLGREMLDQRFAGMKQALQQATPEDVARVQEMLDDLNQLLADHAAGTETPAAVRRFHGTSTASTSRRTRRTPTSSSTCWPRERLPRNG